ncbi:MAG: tripartite tricarboxylate transporter TctB family protein [Deltaproteobacteria bacterium]|nr:tripartite tricarboxylate transporter TctB family protein [Deltaproteobacteria bacterium]
MKRTIPIPMGQLLVGLFWIGVAILTFMGIAALPAADPGGLGPATFPKIIAFSLLGLIALYWFQARRDKPVSFFKSEARGSVLKAASLVALAYASAILWERVGALPVLSAVSIIELKWIEGFGWMKSLGVGMTLPIGMWLVFTQLLGVTLPLGLLIWFY